MSESVRILVLDDDEELRNVLQTVLEAEGYAVVSAPRADAAVELARQFVPDLVVADIRMEGMDGLDALAVMKETNPSMRSLVITGYSTEADSIRAIRLGVGDYLKKPFDLTLFLQSIEKILADRRLEQGRREHEGALRETLLWALRGMLGSLASRDPALARLEPLGHELCARLSLDRATTQEVLLICLYSLSRDLGPGRPQQSLPQGLQSAWQALDEFWDGSGPQGLVGPQIPLVSRVAALLLAAFPLDLAAQSLAVHLEAAQPGRFDPEILAGLAGARPPIAEGARESQGLLTLARALEESQQLSLAEQTYQRLAREQSPGRETAQALQGLARLASRQGLSPAAVGERWKAAQLAAEQVGPGVAANCALRGAIALQQLKDPQFSAWADRASRFFDSLGQPVGRAQAQLLVLSGQSQTNLEQLSQVCQVLGEPQHADDVSCEGPWLVPLLLHRPDWLEVAEARRLVQRFLRDQGRWVAALWRSGRLPEVTRRQLAKQFARFELVSNAAHLLDCLRQDTDADVRGCFGAGPVDPSTAAAAPLLRIYSMSAFEVSRDGEKVPQAAWKTQKVKYMLALLSSRRGRPVSEDVLIEEFWPGDAEKGKQSLYWATSVIRRCLKGLPVDPILRVHSCLQLTPELEHWHDFEELEDRLQTVRPQLRAGQPDVNSLRMLAELHRGPYLEGCYYDWAETVRTRIERQLAEVFEQGAQLLARDGRWGDCREIALASIQIDACNQNAHMLAMQASLAAGRADEAIRQYENCKRMLQREVGSEPGLALFELYQKARLLS